MNGQAARVVERELRVYRRLWRGSLFGTFGFPVLFLASLGIGVGGLVNENTGQVQGLSYLDFVAPGLLAASVLQSAAGHSLWPVMAGTKWIRTYHGMIATPIEPAAVQRGVVWWTVLHTTGAATVFLAIAAVMGGVSSWWAPLALPVCALLAAAVSAPLTAFAASQESDAPFNLLMRLAVQPLFLFSGTFFPVANLPAALEPVAQVSPLYHAVELCRAATTGSVELGAAAVHLGLLGALVVIGVRWGQRSFRRRLAP